MIRELVHAFYAQVRRDPALGPIFNRTVGLRDTFAKAMSKAG